MTNYSREYCRARSCPSHHRTTPHKSMLQAANPKVTKQKTFKGYFAQSNPEFLTTSDNQQKKREKYYPSCQHRENAASESSHHPNLIYINNKKIAVASKKNALPVL